MDSALASASAISDQRQKIEQYKHILSSVIASNDIVQAQTFITHGFTLSLSLRTLISKFLNDFANHSNFELSI